MWDIINDKHSKLYKNRKMDLKIKVVENGEKNKIYINYKGYNLAVPMEIWEFEKECIEWSINSVELGGDDSFNKYYIVEKNDTDVFLDLVYFFLAENNMDSCFHDRYKIH